jgi:Mor family transcriptional regulator
MLRDYCQQGRRTAELTHLLATARASSRQLDNRPLPQQNGLHHSVVKLMIEDYEAGASTYELAERYKVRRNTVRDTLRRAGFDASTGALRAAMSEAQKVEAREAFVTGTTRRELMARYGVSESTIRRVLASARTTSRPASLA